MKRNFFGIRITEVRKTTLSFLMVPVLLSSMIFSTGCNAQEFAQKFNQYAEQIYPAVNSVASILALFGVSIPAAVMPLVRIELTQVEDLMNKFAGASASAQPDIKSQLVAAMQTLQAEITKVFNLAHIDNADKQVQITALVTLISSLVQEMILLIPSSTAPRTLAVSGTVAVKSIESKGDFASQFNKHIDELDKLSPGMKFQKLDQHGTVIHVLSLGMAH